MHFPSPLLLLLLLSCFVLPIFSINPDDYEYSSERMSLLETLNSLTRLTDPTQDYRIGNKLGSGKWGIVFEAVRIKDGQKFAIKKLSTDRTKNIIYAINELKLGPLFEQLNKQAHGPQDNSILHYGTAYHHGHYFWLIMELVPDGMTASKTAREKKMHIGLFNNLMLKCLSLLELLESNGICHRDFTATNVMAMSQGKERTVLIDFGRSVRMRSMGGPKQKHHYEYLDADTQCTDRSKIRLMAELLSSSITPSPSKEQKRDIATLLKGLDDLEKRKTSVASVLASFLKKTGESWDDASHGGLDNAFGATASYWQFASHSSGSAQSANNGFDDEDDGSVTLII